MALTFCFVLEFNSKQIFDTKALEEDAAQFSQISKLAWVRVGPKDCAIHLHESEFLLVLHREGKYNSAIAVMPY
jgi:hypothetical protein